MGFANLTFPLHRELGEEVVFTGTGAEGGGGEPVLNNSSPYRCDISTGVGRSRGMFICM